MPHRARTYLPPPPSAVHHSCHHNRKPCATITATATDPNAALASSTFTTFNPFTFALTAALAEAPRLGGVEAIVERLDALHPFPLVHEPRVALLVKLRRKLGEAE